MIYPRQTLKVGVGVERCHDVVDARQLNVVGDEDPFLAARSRVQLCREAAFQSRSYELSHRAQWAGNENEHNPAATDHVLKVLNADVGVVQHVLRELTAAVELNHAHKGVRDGGTERFAVGRR